MNWQGISQTQVYRHMEQVSKQLEEKLKSFCKLNHCWEYWVREVGIDQDDWRDRLRWGCLIELELWQKVRPDRRSFSVTSIPSDPPTSAARISILTDEDRDEIGTLLAEIFGSDPKLCVVLDRDQSNEVRLVYRLVPIYSLFPVKRLGRAKVQK